MFLYQAPQYANLAALAGARAAEAEYLALEARAPANDQQQSLYWAQPAYYPPVEPSAFGYPACIPQRYNLGGYPQSYPQPYRRVMPHAEPSLAERELEVRLKEERLARLQAEYRLKLREQELAERERRLSHPAFAGLTGGKARDEYAAFFPFFGLPARAQAQAAKPKTSPEASYGLLEQALLHSIPKSASKKKMEQSPPTMKSSVEGSLIDQLKARYEKEGEDEVRDTIQAIINSLSDSTGQSTFSNQDLDAAAISALSNNPSRPSNISRRDLVNSICATINALSAPLPVNPTASTSKSAVSSSTGSPSVKDKETPSLSGSKSRDVKNALELVESIEDTFKHLAADFVFPPQIDFISTPYNIALTSGGLPHLAFTARTHPVRLYEQTLTSLLNQLDLIESHGNADLRHRRKDAVYSIEKALEELEREIVGRWKAKLAEEQKEGSGRSEASSAEAALPVWIPIVGNSVGEEECAGSEVEGSASKSVEATGREEVEFSTSPHDESAEVEETDAACRHTDGPLPSGVKSLSIKSEQEGFIVEGVPEVPESAFSTDEGPTTVVEFGSDSASELAPAQDQFSGPDDDSNEDTSQEDQRGSPSPKAKKGHRRSASVEDLGSDWSDVEA